VLLAWYSIKRFHISWVVFWWCEWFCQQLFRFFATSRGHTTGACIVMFSSDDWRLQRKPDI